MKRLRIYIWCAAFIFLANGWLSYALSSSTFFSAEQPPFWQKALTEIALFSQLPSLPVGKAVAEFFDLSYPTWAIATSVISILIYFPLIHLSRPWRPRVRVRSILLTVTAFSSSLNPRIPALKREKDLELRHYRRANEVSGF